MTTQSSAAATLLIAKLFDRETLISILSTMTEMNPLDESECERLGLEPRADSFNEALCTALSNGDTNAEQVLDTLEEEASSFMEIFRDCVINDWIDNNRPRNRQ